MTDAALFGHRSGTPDFAGTLNQVIGSTGPDYPDRTIKTHAGRTGRNQETSAFVSCRDHENKHDYLHADAVYIDTRMLHLMENNITYKNTTEKLLQQMTIITHAMGEGGK